MHSRVTARLIAVCSGTDHEPMLDFQVIAGNMEAGFHLGRAGALYLDRNLWCSALLKNQIDFGTICGPIKQRSGIRTCGLDQSLYHESLPACSDHRVAEQLVERTDFEKCMHEPAVAYVNLRGTHETLAQITTPWGHPAHKHEIDQQVDIAADHWCGHTETLRKPRI